MKFLAAISTLVVLLATPALSQLTRNQQRWVDQTLRSMTLEEKVGQLLVPTITGSFRNRESEEFEKARHDIVDLHVGGYHTWGGDPAATAVTLNELQQLAKVPLLITADLEGGPAYILPGATRLPLAMAIGATGDERYARMAGKITAEEARAVGIHVNFYPVADVQNNPRNPIINIRSFGEDPARVGAFARAYIRGAQESGQIATAKHFPGHGDVSSDSHLVMPTIDFTRERLDTTELPPFKAAVDEGVAAVMTAHIYLSQIEPQKDVPATLSRNVVDILRNDMGFKGVVFTDAMTMEGVAAAFDDSDATVRAFEAGHDIILHPVNVDNSFKALVDAVRSGRITTERLDQSVRRVLEAKARLGLEKRPAFDVDHLNEIVGSRKNREVAREIAEAAITLVRDEPKALPLAPSEEQRMLHINLVDQRTGRRDDGVGNTFGNEMLKRFPKGTTIQLDDQSGPGEYQLARKMIANSDAVVVSGFIRVAAYKGSIDLSSQQVALLRDLSTQKKKPFVFALFGSPYVLTQIPELTSYILGYDTSPVTETAAVRAITGEIPFRGKLPISLPGLYPVGYQLPR
jgi:beta-N-acetylhexosaminidase